MLWRQQRLRFQFGSRSQDSKSCSRDTEAIKTAKRSGNESVFSRSTTTAQIQRDALLFVAEHVVHRHQEAQGLRKRIMEMVWVRELQIDELVVGDRVRFPRKVRQRHLLKSELVGIVVVAREQRFCIFLTGSVSANAVYPRRARRAFQAEPARGGGCVALALPNGARLAAGERVASGQAPRAEPQRLGSEMVDFDLDEASAQRQREGGRGQPAHHPRVCMEDGDRQEARRDWPLPTAVPQRAAFDISVCFEFIFLFLRIESVS